MTQRGSRPAWRRDKRPNADAERTVTTNAWAFLRLLAASGGPDLYDWWSLVAWAHAHPAAFSDAMAAFLNDDIGAAWAEPVLFLDVRPDDRLLVAGPDAWPWPSRAGPRAAPVHSPATNAATLLADAVTIGASVVVAPAAWLEVAVAPGVSLSGLRVVLGLGAPISAATRRTFARAPTGVVILARQDGLTWGNPLDPAEECPVAAPALGAWGTLR